MQQLFQNYSVGQILVFIVITALAIKELVSFIEWSNEKMGKKVDKDRETNNLKEKFTTILEEKNKQLSEIKRKEEQLEENLLHLTQKIDMLIASDKDDIKAWITAQHHHFMEKECIDYYSFECISKRYEDYKREGGNTFIDDLMEDIYTLPKIGDKIKEHKI